MSRPLLLDLFSGAGGAAMGYHRAGFDVVGVDIDPQPNYPFEFVRTDAFTYLERHYAGFAVVHASPPCQAHSTLKHSPGGRDDYPDLVVGTRRRLQVLHRARGTHYIIENVVGAPLVDPIKLCGSQFGLTADGYELRRHRLFETSFPLLQPECRHELPVLGVYGDLAKHPRPSTRGVKAGIDQANHLMGIDWMTPKELTQAIPPAYSEWIGTQLLAHLEAAA